MESVEAIVQYRRLKWHRHLVKMSGLRLPKELLFACIQCETPISRSRPQKSRLDYAREDLAKLH